MGEPSTTRNIVVVSPHFDDVPLSLGESLRSGVLSLHNVRVRTVFGRTNWTSLLHPTPSRTKLVSLWRRIEETAASIVFGYRWSAAGWSEVVLREGELDPSSYLDPQVDLGDDPLVSELEAWLLRVLGAPTAGRDRARASGGPAGPWGGRRRRWSDRPDLLLVPAGLGGHRDHRLVAVAAGRLIGATPVPIGFYEDRPYRSYLDEGTVEQNVVALTGGAAAVSVSEPVRRSTQMLARICYPSQMSPYFREAMSMDRSTGSVETVWFVPGSRPEWFGRPR